MSFEIYALCNQRSSDLGEKFLDNFLLERKPIVTEYSYPEFSEKPECIFTNYKELLNKLEINNNESYTIYWKSKNYKNIIENVILSFTEDEGMIVGLVVSSEVSNYFQKLISFIDAKYAYATVNYAEFPPPLTQQEFIEDCCKLNDSFLFQRCPVQTDK